MSYLSPALIGEFNPMIRDHLVDFPVFVALRLCMADQDDEARFPHG